MDRGQFKQIVQYEFNNNQYEFNNNQYKINNNQYELCHEAQTWHHFVKYHHFTAIDFIIIILINLSFQIHNNYIENVS